MRKLKYNHALFKMRAAQDISRENVDTDVTIVSDGINLDTDFGGIDNIYSGVDENRLEELFMLELADEGVISREELEMWWV